MAGSLATKQDEELTSAIIRLVSPRNSQLRAETNHEEAETADDATSPYDAESCHPQDGPTFFLVHSWLQGEVLQVDIAVRALH